MVKKKIKRKKLPPHSNQPWPLTASGEVNKTLVIAVITILAIVGLSLLLLFSDQLVGKAISYQATVPQDQVGVFLDPSSEVKENEKFSLKYQANIGTKISDAVEFSIDLSPLGLTCGQVNVSSLLGQNVVYNKTSCLAGNTLKVEYAGLFSNTGTFDIIEVDFPGLNPGTYTLTGSYGIFDAQGNVIGSLTPVHPRLVVKSASQQQRFALPDLTVDCQPASVPLNDLVACKLTFNSTDFNANPFTMTGSDIVLKFDTTLLQYGRFEPPQAALGQRTATFGVSAANLLSISDTSNVQSHEIGTIYFTTLKQGTGNLEVSSLGLGTGANLQYSIGGPVFSNQITVTAATCTANNQCPAGQVCLQGGLCGTPLPAGQACTATSQCAQRLQCTNGTCTATPPTNVTAGGKCTATSQCAQGLQCTSGTCVPASCSAQSPCPTGFSCVANACVQTSLQTVQSGFLKVEELVPQQGAKWTYRTRITALKDVGPYDVVIQLLNSSRRGQVLVYDKRAMSSMKQNDVREIQTVFDTKGVNKTVIVHNGTFTNQGLGVPTLRVEHK